MMTSSFEAVDLVFHVLRPSALKDAITGDVWKQELPLNSNNEDVVINCIALTNDDLQSGTLNVNIHVPNLSIPSGNTEDRTQPNWKRLKELTAIAFPLLNEVYSTEYWFSIQQQNLISQSDLYKHFVNIRLDFKSVNI